MFTTSSDSADVTTCLWLNGRLYCHLGYVSISCEDLPATGTLNSCYFKTSLFITAKWAAAAWSRVWVFVTFLMSAGRNFLVSQQTKVFFQSQFFYLHRETHKRTYVHLLLTLTWVQTCFQSRSSKTHDAVTIWRQSICTLVYTHALKNKVLSAAGWICLSPLSDHQDALFHFTWKIKHQKIVSKISWTCKRSHPCSASVFYHCHRDDICRLMKLRARSKQQSERLPLELWRCRLFLQKSS